MFFSKIWVFCLCKSSSSYFLLWRSMCANLHIHIRLCSWSMLVHLKFTLFIFSTAVFIPDLNAAILTSQTWHVFFFPVISCNLAWRIRGWEIRAIFFFASSLHSSFVLHSGLCRRGKETLRCAVKILEKGNEQTLSPTDLDTIQIGFARIPATHPLSLFCPRPNPHDPLPFVLYC